MLAMNKVWLIFWAAGLLLSGCTADRQMEKVTTMTAEDMLSPVLAIDITDQGVMKISGLQGVQPFAVTEEKQVVLLGEAFVARNGLPLGGRRLSQELSQSNKQPIIALVNGTAEALLAQSSTLEQWMPELRRADAELNSFHRYRENRLRDRFVPFVLSSGSSGKMVIQTAVMRGDKPSVVLNQEDIQLLSCIDGHKRISGLPMEGANGSTTIVNCRTQWSGNGDLKSPSIKAVVTVSMDGNQSMDAKSKAAAEGVLEQQLARVIRQLQDQHIDPLDIGQVIRSQYRGVWTTDRWRSAFSRAEVHIDVRLNV
ncbi:Ger(x)C family spore germination C-terminal domain-containing protein [Paenibacillus sp. UNC451MF]|uniref:Ger(x)C family spore germination C-terminal domain-containing protein n=1 Tax=Paenibacillus sp. UNC451MF TaxID=1449063 RepID=UPI0004901241|nr:Ger(x)C family spore germination C-terminal domain-containing protein [Paenibacillus sp. UNC451MF]